MSDGQPPLKSRITFLVWLLAHFLQWVPYPLPGHSFLALYHLTLQFWSHSLDYLSQFNTFKIVFINQCNPNLFPQLRWLSWIIHSYTQPISSLEFLIDIWNLIYLKLNDWSFSWNCSPISKFSPTSACCYTSSSLLRPKLMGSYGFSLFPINPINISVLISLLIFLVLTTLINILVYLPLK